MTTPTIKNTFAACGATFGEIDALYDIVGLRTAEDLCILTSTDIKEMCKLHNKNVDSSPRVAVQPAPAEAGDAEEEEEEAPVVGPEGAGAEVAQQGEPLHVLRGRVIHAVVDEADDDSVESLPLPVAPQALVAVPTKISYKVTMNLTYACSEVKLASYTSRDIELIYRSNSRMLPLWRRHMDEWESFKDPTEKAPEASMISKNWVKGFELLEQWISRHFATKDRIPLGFLIREKEPETGPYRSSDYATVVEMFDRRTPVLLRTSSGAMVEAQYVAQCRMKLWDILMDIFKDHSAYQQMKPFRSKKDGQAALRAIKDHYLGKNRVNDMTTALEAELDALTYTGESKRWNFEKYVGKHVELYNTACDLEQHGYHGLDAATRVRKLVSGIKTDKLDSCKNQVWSNRDLQTDFEAVVSLFKSAISQHKSNNRNNPATIGAVESGERSSGSKRQGQGRGQGQGKGSRKKAKVAAADVQDRFYTKEEYNNLTSEQKKALHEKRKARKAADAAGGGMTDPTVAALQAQINALQVQVGTARASTGESNGEANTGGTSNRHHQALLR